VRGWGRRHPVWLATRAQAAVGAERGGWGPGEPGGVSARCAHDRDAPARGHLCLCSFVRFFVVLPRVFVSKILVWRAPRLFVGNTPFFLPVLRVRAHGLQGMGLMQVQTAAAWCPRGLVPGEWWPFRKAPGAASAALTLRRGATTGPGAGCVIKQLRFVS